MVDAERNVDLRFSSLSGTRDKILRKSLRMNPKLFGRKSECLVEVRDIGVNSVAPEDSS